MNRETLYDAGGIGRVHPVPLRAGPLEMEFEPETGFLRCIRLGEEEVVRAVYAAVRDHEWTTIRPEISDLEWSRTPRSFDLSFDVRAVAEPVDFRWSSRIVGNEDGTVRIEMEGEARRAFRRNRIGFCVLHPPHLAGASCRELHPEGEESTARFPERIRPEPIFRDLAGLRHAIDLDGEVESESEVESEVEVEFRFEGDLFETEDQRNWTDGSYKTYCTPVDRPAPVELERGDRVVQSVSVSVERSERTEGSSGTGLGAGAGAGGSTARPTSFVRLRAPRPDSGRKEPEGRLPRLGLEIVAPEDWTAVHRERLEALQLDHARIEVHADEADWRSQFESRAQAALELGADLEVAVFADAFSSQTGGDVASALETVSDSLARVLVYPPMYGDRGWVSDADLLRGAREELSAVMDGAPLFGGTNAYFADLNGSYPEAEEIDGYTYSINPQVHAFDNRSMVETLQAQGETVTTAKVAAADPAVAVSPVTLHPRFNPDASAPPPEPAPGELPYEVDPRQATLFGAAWTYASIGALGEAGCDSITYFRAVGGGGLLPGSDLAEHSAWPFDADGGVHPLYHALADLAPRSGAALESWTSDRPLRVRAFALRSSEGSSAYVMNLTDEVQVAEFDLPERPQRVRIRRLDETTAEEAISKPKAFRARPGRERETDGGTVRLSLLPYATARVEPVRPPGPQV